MRTLYIHVSYIGANNYLSGQKSAGPRVGGRIGDSADARRGADRDECGLVAVLQ